jgi:hypothetical protein
MDSGVRGLGSSFQSGNRRSPTLSSIIEEFTTPDGLAAVFLRAGKTARFFLDGSTELCAFCPQHQPPCPVTEHPVFLIPRHGVGDEPNYLPFPYIHYL